MEREEAGASGVEVKCVAIDGRRMVVFFAAHFFFCSWPNCRKNWRIPNSYLERKLASLTRANIKRFLNIHSPLLSLLRNRCQPMLGVYRYTFLKKKMIPYSNSGVLSLRRRRWEGCSQESARSPSWERTRRRQSLPSGTISGERRIAPRSPVERMKGRRRRRWRRGGKGGDQGKAAAFFCLSIFFLPGKRSNISHMRKPRFDFKLMPVLKYPSVTNKRFSFTKLTYGYYNTWINFPYSSESNIFHFTR